MALAATSRSGSSGPSTLSRCRPRTHAPTLRSRRDVLLLARESSLLRLRLASPARSQPVDSRLAVALRPSPACWRSDCQGRGAPGSRRGGCRSDDRPRGPQESRRRSARRPIGALSPSSAAGGRTAIESGDIHRSRRCRSHPGVATPSTPSSRCSSSQPWPRTSRRWIGHELRRQLDRRAGSISRSASSTNREQRSEPPHTLQLSTYANSSAVR